MSHLFKSLLLAQSLTMKIKKIGNENGAISKR